MLVGIGRSKGLERRSDDMEGDNEEKRFRVFFILVIGYICSIKGFRIF